jgi:hypothetical protein
MEIRKRIEFPATNKILYMLTWPREYLSRFILACMELTRILHLIVILCVHEFVCDERIGKEMSFGSFPLP